MVQLVFFKLVSVDWKFCRFTLLPTINAAVRPEICETLSFKNQCAELGKQNCTSNASPGWRLHGVGGSFYFLFMAQIPLFNESREA